MLKGKGVKVNRLRANLVKLYGALAASLLVLSAPVQAQVRVIVIDPNALPYELGPSKYDNSPTKYDNSSSKYDNSISKYDNSPSKYDNSPSKYENSNGKNRLITSDGKGVGYAVFSSEGVFNIFSRSGKRLAYVPNGSHTQSIFQSEGDAWCGTLGEVKGELVIGLVRSCFFRLLSDQ